ncbi:MAG: APC family permease [Antricoccus sp.]
MSAAPVSEGPPEAPIDTDITHAGLASKSMGQIEVFAQSLAGIAPSAVMATGPALIVVSAGNGTWLSYGIAMVTVLLIGLCIVQFGNRIASTGSLYSYVAHSLGSGSAFTTGWTLAIGYIFIAMTGAAGTALYGAGFLGAFGINAQNKPAYLIILIVAIVLATALAAVGIKLSTRFGLILEIFSLLAILTLLVATLFHHGVTDHAQIHLTGASSNGITFGVVLGTLGFVGFESAAALGAEARDPHRAIPRAVLISAIVVGVLYIFSAYVSVKGLGAVALAKSADPMDDLSKAANMGGFRYVIDLGVMMSFFAVIIASINAASRIYYTMAHEQMMPKPIGKTHRTHRTPHVAIMAIFPAVLIVPAIMLITGTTPLNIIAYTGTIGTFGYLTAYLLMAVGMPTFMRSHRAMRAYHPVIAIAATLAIIYVVYKNLVPVPPSPYNILPYIYLGLLVIGIVWYLAIRWRAPERTKLVGTFEEELSPLHVESLAARDT